MSEKRKILFVDDEPCVLDGLRRMMHAMRNDYETDLVESGEVALESMSREDFDVIVSDMRMPGMDGAELLAEVKSRHPKAVRIALSGQTDKAVIYRCLAPTHQFLAKPCSAETLKSTLKRACTLRDMMNMEKLKELLTGMESLPSLPSVYNELVKELQSSDTSIKRVEQIISRDLGMVTKIMQMVNSAFFGLRKHVSSPGQAIVLLGLDTIKALVLSAQVLTQFNQSELEGLSLESLWQHSMAVGGLAKQIAKTETTEQEAVDKAFIAGMLHDVGKLVFATKLPDDYRRALSVAKEEKIIPAEAERQVISASHAEVGGFLLGLWGFDESIVEALVYHHNPKNNLTKAYSSLTAVHAANAFVYEGDDQSGPNPKLDISYFTEIGLENRLLVWREICRGMKQKEGADNEREHPVRR